MNCTDFFIFPSLSHRRQADLTLAACGKGALQNLPGWWFGTFGLCFHILGIMIPTD